MNGGEAGRRGVIGRMSRYVAADGPGAASGEGVEQDRDLPVILVATDGTEDSLEAGEQAVRLAHRMGAGLVALYVVDENAAFHSGIHYGDAAEELAEDGREATASVAALAAGAGVEHREMVVAGKPHRAIVSVAEELEATYVVLGSHRGSAIERMVLGSVSGNVLHLCSRPVLVVGGGHSVGRRASSETKTLSAT